MDYFAIPYSHFCFDPEQLKLVPADISEVVLCEDNQFDTDDIANIVLTDSKKADLDSLDDLESFFI